MKLIVDANIFVAAFLRHAVTRELLLDGQIELITPEYGLLEAHKILKQPKILKRLGLSIENFEEPWSILTSSVEVIAESEFQSTMHDARKLISDPADIPYLACALKFELPIWSNDTDFQTPKVKNCVSIFTTSELIEWLKR